VGRRIVSDIGEAGARGVSYGSTNRIIIRDLNNIYFV